MALIKKRDFFFDLFEKQIIPEPFESIESDETGIKLLEQGINDKNAKTQYIYSIKSVPKYICPKINEQYNFKKVLQHHKSYSIRIYDKFSNVDEYLKTQFKSKAKEIRRYVKRLENCFDISYRMYYGDISKSDYDILFNSLYTMLESRFKQKKEINERLLEWERLYDMFYLLIKEKKAAIFVVYESKIPISISLNYIFEKYYFNAIASYDIKYSKFGLGNIIIYKQLQWCINNNINIYEMGRGDWAYKRRWSNFIYSLEHFVIVPKKTTKKIIYLAKVEFFKIKILECLRSKGVNRMYNKVKSFPNRFLINNKEINSYKLIVIEEENILFEELKVINFLDEEYSFLKEPLNEFLYVNKEYKGDVEIYNNHKKRYEFIIIGKNVKQRIIFKSH